LKVTRARYCRTPRQISKNCLRVTPNRLPFRGLRISRSRSRGTRIELARRRDSTRRFSVRFPYRRRSRQNRSRWWVDDTFEQSATLRCPAPPDASRARPPRWPRHVPRRIVFRLSRWLQREFLSPLPGVRGFVGPALSPE